MNYKRETVVLYSWFQRNNNKPNKKSIQAKNDLIKSSEMVQYIRNVTMWPTAKIKQNIDVAFPIYDNVESKLPKEPNEPISSTEDNSLSFKTTLLLTK